MEASSSSSSSSMNDSIQTSHNTKNTLSSDMIVTSYIQKGLQDVVVYTSIGVVVGGLMGIVLATRGSSSSSAARKVYTSLGGGIGFGTAWTNTSIQFEQLLLSSSSSSSSSSLPNTTTNATTSNEK